MRGIEQPDDTAGSCSGRALARLVFFAFLLTFIAARVLVFLIMSRRLPDLFLHVGGTHVHHLNYGIFLLCVVGAYLLFARPTDARLRKAAVLYAVGLALTFDEFGMWLHLGGSYWQRGSYDAVAVLVGVLGFAAYFPPRKAQQQRPMWQAAAVTVLTIVFFVMLADSFRYVGGRLDPKMRQIENLGPE
jgi:glucose dehydrogenase